MTGAWGGDRRRRERAEAERKRLARRDEQAHHIAQIDTGSASGYDYSSSSSDAGSSDSSSGGGCE